jgi:hypothetical protein
LAILAVPAAAQTSSTAQTLQSPPPDEHRVADTVKFHAGAALGLGMHEGGHLVFDTVFDANPTIEGVRDERAIGATVLAPAILDAVRYFKPEARWATRASRAAKAGSVLLVIRKNR